jgi:DNA-binding beta-propeller fold protein YncE
MLNFDGLKLRSAGAARMVFSTAAVLGLVLSLPLPALAMKVVSEKTATGFKFPESVAYDPEAKVLYVGSFGGTELKPGEKDNNGYISKVSLDGKMLEERFLPEPGVTMNKPKGIWVKGSRLWVTDIDGVWEFDTKTKKGKKLELPGSQFANDPAIVGNTLYVSDNRRDALYKVTPADFLDMKEGPDVFTVWKDKGINPNGVYPGRDGTLLIVGFKSDTEKRGIYSMKPGEDPTVLVKDVGRLDGLYQMKDGTLIVTDWDSGTVFTWSKKAGRTPIASGFKGPADLCAFPHDGGLMVIVPDLVKGELRMIQLAN